MLTRGAVFVWEKPSGSVRCVVNRVADDRTWADFTMTSGGSSWGERIALPLPESFREDQLMGVGYGYNGRVVKAEDMTPMPLTLRDITAEVRAVNIAKGWRSASGGPGNNTFGDYIALAHSELSEALEAYRSWRLADATGSDPDNPDTAMKPEGVGSEFADLLIRLVDMADVFGIDLEAEYRRKIAYNRTRAFQHGGRTLADDPRVASGGGKTTRLYALLEAIPDDPRDWWAGDEVDRFIQAWTDQDLPELTMQDAEGETLTLWCTDLDYAAALLGETLTRDGERQALLLKRGEYVVCVMQAETKETNHAQ
jgi:NTP pyrophosphatase (non-canonical NTP hydrolase)